MLSKFRFVVKNDECAGIFNILKYPKHVILCFKGLYVFRLIRVKLVLQEHICLINMFLRFSYFELSDFC